jgi:hypothetical protein
MSQSVPIRVKSMKRKAFVARCLLVGSFLFLVATRVGLPQAAAQTQELRIRVLDGRSGRPISKEQVNVWIGNIPATSGFGGKDGTAFLLSTDKSGEAALPIAVNHKEWIEIETDYYFDCRPFRRNATRPTYPVKEVLQSGIVTDNTCGKFRAEPRHGELTFIVRHLHWWESFKR